jgi:hypothetical protein
VNDGKEEDEDEESIMNSSRNEKGIPKLGNES